VPTDLYINLRPVQLLHPDLTPLRTDKPTGTREAAGWVAQHVAAS
jgi:hypothetical protein